MFYNYRTGVRDKAALDMAAVFVFLVNILERVFRKLGYALKMRWQHKWVKHGQAFGAEDIIFMLLMVYSLGA